MQSGSESDKKRMHEKEEKMGFKDGLMAALGDMFNGCPIEDNQEASEIKIIMDMKEIKVDYKTCKVKCEDDKQIEQIIGNVIQQVKNICL